MSIKIINVKTETIASQYVVYVFTINHNNQQEWTIKKRYSDFLELHDKLKPPFNLPPKRYWSTSSAVVDERKLQLRQYLLQCIQFINHPIFREFLGLDVELSKQSLTFEKDFYKDVQIIENQLDDIETLIQKRVECVRNNQIHQSYKINQDINLKVTPIKEFLPTLYQLMQTDKSSGGEYERKMKSYRELEMKVQSILKQIQESPRKRVLGSSSPSSTSIPVPVTSYNNFVPGSLNKTESLPTFTSTSLPNGQVMLKQQDQQLELIRQSLRVQKQIGLDMSSEIALQNRLLDDINADVDKVDRKVNMASKRTKKLT
eukprot:NODE_43_length_33755_cov_1.178542.p12 type:complete len:316 gc:universal NODE_43_length_33755_cov_1.178542:13129-12182(-)